MEPKLIPDQDYYLDDIGRMVFTETYHLKRGYCCGNNCKHCPWQHLCQEERPHKGEERR